MALTPMMKQYLEIKEQHKEEVLFFRLGDFYEMFFEDAVKCSKELELTLTGKDCGLENRAPMCGIPYHSANTYIEKLIEKGYKIAICEQTEDPKFAQGIVKREVIKIITPGTLVETNLLDEKQSNYILCFKIVKDSCVIAYADISTGEVYLSYEMKDNAKYKVINEIAKISPTEILSDKIDVDIKKRFISYMTEYDNKVSDEVLNKYIEDLNITNLQKDVISNLFSYITHTQKNSINQINKVNLYNSDIYMNIDMSSRKSLEITENITGKSKKGTLLYILDKTNTSMGSRLLRKWIESPLTCKEEILKRQDAVEEMLTKNIITDEVKNMLSNVFDIERIITKVVNLTVNPKELVTLKNSFKTLPELKSILKNYDTSIYLKEIYDKFDDLNDIYNLLESSIKEDPNILFKEGNIIKSGFNKEIDELKEISLKSQEYLLNLEAKEKEISGIKTLKVGYSKIFGYFLEVTNSYKHLVNRERYRSTQTLAGCERFITDELKELENKILTAKDKLNEIEYLAFCDIRKKVGENIVRVQNMSSLIAIIDTLVSYAMSASEYGYIKPEINDKNVIEILGGRHPVVEANLKDENFIPNDTYLDNNNNLVNIITGPNMSGKSTYMRQVALITYMMQIGSFVPANKANLCICDSIFTRIGASDDLSMGKSTFMVEMSELANILNNATKNSLVLLDEIGRGTSTYDGLAIAFATTEEIANNVKCKTLFATHYHELTELAEKTDNVKNYQVDVKENLGEVIFLHKIKKGSINDSYGIYVAKIAGVKKHVVTRAKEILKEFEITDKAKKSINEAKNINAEDIAVNMFNYSINEVATIIKDIDLDDISGKEALDMLYKLKEKLG